MRVRKHTKSNLKLIEKISMLRNWKSAFDWVSNVSFNGIYMVSLNGKTSHYKPSENRFISEYWFDDAHNFDHFGRWDGCAIVKNGGKFNVVCLNGELLLKRWYDYIGYLGEDTFFVCEGNKEYQFDLNGNKLNKID